jgi:hypothetical protein
MVGQHSTANLPDYASLTKLNNTTGSTGAASVACWDYGYNGLEYFKLFFVIPNNLWHKKDYQTPFLQVAIAPLV